MIESLKPLYNRSSHLGEQLVNDGVISQEQLNQALGRQSQASPKKFLGETLLQLGFVTPKALGRYLEVATKCTFIELTDFQIDMELAKQIPELKLRNTLKALPIKDRGNDIMVAMSDPLNLGAVDELVSIFNRRITPVLVFERDLEDAFKRVFDISGKTDEIIGRLQDTPTLTSEAPDEEDDETAVGKAGQAPIVEAVNHIILGAINLGASDIHIEPQDGSVRVRYRVDGLLHDQEMPISSKNQPAIASRIKIMARCNIAERRRPQDGRIPLKWGGREHDLRVSIMPTIYGEKIVMRILERNSQHTNLEQMGFLEEQYKIFENFILRPHGMILITGPTGSGKSTTLQAALAKKNNSNINISTVEDPVEYRLPGVNHTQVDHKIGVTFATGLRTLVRQDPDVIMVGEIRDAETAEIAIQAALTGHLVLSTLHTNDAPGAITRLMNMGIEPFLIASAVIGIVGQRLIRTICANCREIVPATPMEMEALGMVEMDTFSTPTLARGRGCPKCGTRGMKGRQGVYEIMPMTDEIRSLTLKRSSSAEIRDMALSQGMKAMRECGLRKVRQHITTLDEIARVLVVEE